MAVQRVRCLTLETIALSHHQFPRSGTRTCSVEGSASESGGARQIRIRLASISVKGRIRLRNVLLTVTGPLLWAGSFAVNLANVTCPIG